MITTTGDARGLIIGAVLIAGTLTTVNDVSHGRSPQLRTAVGCVVAGTLLAALAGPAPGVAGGLAALLAVAAVLTTGAPALGAITKGLQK
ncbi:MAG: hypothetical protein JWO67_17 [Streptosporangiaceae bacterium]|nr:hypothetical protein [Streptosporangiaceae bacterium]